MEAGNINVAVSSAVILTEIHLQLQRKIKTRATHQH